MKVDAQCKFCKAKIVLDMDEDYCLRGDPYKLVAMAACQRCADWQSARRFLYGRIKIHCEALIQGVVRTNEERGVTEQALRKLLSKYIKRMSEYRREPLPEWDESILEALLASPSNFSNILSRIPSLFRQAKLI
jgi:hypothetical protein